MSQEKLAAQSGVALRTIARIETGSVDCLVGTLERIAEVLDVDVAELLEELTVTDHG